MAMYTRVLRNKVGRTLVSLLVWASLPAVAQTYAGRVLGNAQDQTGGIIRGATVTISDVEKGVTRIVATGESGDYNAPDLPPGTYTVRVTAKGFNSVERSGIQLEV